MARSSLRHRVPYLTPQTMKSTSTIPTGVTGFPEYPIYQGGTGIIFDLAKRYTAYARVNNGAGYATTTTVLVIDTLTFIDRDNSDVETTITTAAQIAQYGLASLKVTFHGGADETLDPGELNSTDNNQYSQTAASLTTVQLTLSSGLLDAVVDNEKIYFHTLSNSKNSTQVDAMIAYETAGYNEDVGAINNGAGYAIGATAITTDGFSPAMVADRYIKFAGHDTVYAVTSIGGGNNWTISPGLTSAVVDDEVIIRLGQPISVDTSLVIGVTVIITVGFTTLPALGSKFKFSNHSTEYTVIGRSGSTITFSPALTANVDGSGTPPNIDAVVLSDKGSCNDIGISLFNNVGAGTEVATAFVVHLGKLKVYTLAAGVWSSASNSAPLAQVYLRKATNIKLILLAGTVTAYQDGTLLVFSGGNPSVSGNNYTAIVSGIIDTINVDGQRAYLDSLNEYQP